MAHVLRLENVSKSYFIQEQEIPIIKGLSLEIGQGEFVSIMGPSGSGKSTLLHLMGGLDHPTSGRVIINGKDISHYDDAALARLRNRSLGFIFQNFYLLNYYSAFENVCLPLIYSGRSGLKKPAAKELLQKVGLGHRLHHKPHQLSGGERQRVAIARALVNNPPLLFADEPTGNLDSKTGAAILDILKAIHQNGTAIVLITHDPSIAKHASRHLYIEDGQLV